MATGILTDALPAASAYNERMTKQTTTEKQEDKLDVIIRHLERLDRRDSLRMWGSLLRSLLSIGWLAFLILSTWYALTHWDTILKSVASEAAKQAASYTTKESQSTIDSLQKLLQGR